MLTSVPSEVLKNLTSSLACDMHNFSFVGGGCINQGGKLETSIGNFFLKWNHAFKYPSMFEVEAKGLALLKDAHVTHIPAVINHGQVDSYQYLVLEYIDSASMSGNYWQTLGQQLAALHQISSPTFGLQYNNYIGSLHQYNQQQVDWIKFFIEQRLELQLKLAVLNKLIDQTLLQQFDTLYTKLPQLLPEEKPSLLHGDLWNGNVITNGKGEPCLIDPAVYYGNREAELAFTQLFGGFDSEFYYAYEEASPLQPGFTQRVDIYNLYPLLVHANIFGASYVYQVKSVIKKFV